MMSEFLVYFGAALIYDMISRAMFPNEERPWYHCILLCVLYFGLLFKLMETWKS